MTMKIHIQETITLFDGKFHGEPIYYMVTYSNCSPQVTIFDKAKFDILLRKRETISISERNTYFKCCQIASTTFSNKDFEPQQKTKARRIDYLY